VYRAVKPSWRKAVSAAVSVAMLLPVAALVSTLLLGVIMQTGMSRRAAANAADLKAEEAKKLLRVTILRGPSNESLVNIYAAGKLPIQVDYLIAEGYDGSVIAERNEIILVLRPGDNVTVTPGWLDPGLEGYNNDFWRMRREVRSLILHTSDGNTFYASWGPWNKEFVATVVR
jgi:archaellum component FlaF (FlaF/FlaG flagellin family)